MTRPDGTPVNAVFGFTNMLLKPVDRSPTPTTSPWSSTRARLTFRNDIYPDYKAHRPEPPEDLIPQFALIRDATRAFDVASVELEGFEADDLIATYARSPARPRAAGHHRLVRQGPDAAGAATGVAMLDPMKNRSRSARTRCSRSSASAPDKVVDVQALAGDSADNVPGVPGIGVKTAAQLINEYGDLDTLLARAGEIKQPKRRESADRATPRRRASRGELVLLRRRRADAGADRRPWPRSRRDAARHFLRRRASARFLARMKRLGEASTRSPRRRRGRARRRMAGTRAGDAGTRRARRPATRLVQDRGGAGSAGSPRRTRPAWSRWTPRPTVARRHARRRWWASRWPSQPGRACYVPLRHGGERRQGARSRRPAGGRPPRQIPLQTALSCSSRCSTTRPC